MTHQSNKRNCISSSNIALRGRTTNFPLKNISQIFKVMIKNGFEIAGSRLVLPQQLLQKAKVGILGIFSG